MRFRILALALCLVMLLVLMPMVTFAAEGTDGLVSVSASKSEVNVGDTLVLTFKVNAKTDPLGSINFTVNLPAGLEYVSDEQLHTTHGFLMGAYTPSTGVYGCAVTTAGKSGEFEILKLTVKAVTAGDHVVSVTLGNMSKVDGSTMMDFGTVAPITIRATGAAHTCQHDHYNTTETTHQSVCACGQTIGEAAGHTGGTATCNAKAKCEICESEYGEVDKKNHVGQTEIRDAVTPSCNKPGYSGDTYCKSCNEKIADGREIAATGEHKGGTATCVAKATCEVCGQSYGDVNKSNHVGDTEVRDAVKETCGKPGYSGDTYCKSCNEKIADGREIAATGDHKGGTATCIHKATCEVCGLTYGELDPKNHVGEEKLVDKSEPTCVEEGYTGDIWCLSCNEMKVRGQILPATGKHAGTYRFTWDWDANHNECTLVVWFHCNTCNNDIAFKNAKDAGVVTKVATCKETGIRTYTFDLSGAELPGNCTWDNFVLLNNDLGDRAVLSQEFVENLQRRTGLPVEMWDERLTTVAAHNSLIEGGMRREKRAQIVDEVKEQAAPGGPMLVFMNMVNIAMLLSVSLGVMNLLPLPALDGGRLVFLIIEVLRGKPLPPEKESIIHLAGFVALMILMVFVFFNDIQRIIG